jgi:hypothetical protein
MVSDTADEAKWRAEFELALTEAHYDGTVSPQGIGYHAHPPYRRGISGQAVRCSPHRRMGPNSRRVPGNFNGRRVVIQLEEGIQADNSRAEGSAPSVCCPVRRSGLGTAALGRALRPRALSPSPASPTVRGIVPSRRGGAGGPGGAGIGHPAGFPQAR